MEKCGEGVVDAVGDVIVLGFELGDNTIERVPHMALQLFQQDKVQEAIRKALFEEGKRLAAEQRKDKTINNDDGTKVLAAVGKAAGGAAQKWAANEIEKSSDYKNLEKGLKRLECRFKESPVGVFIDENKGLLIVVASGLAIGGVAAMYATRSGDWPAGQLADLASKKLRLKVLGNVELGVQGLAFKPSERDVGATPFITAKWKAVKTSLNVNVAFKEDSLAKSSVRGEVVVDIAKGASLSGKGAVGYVRPQNPWEKSLTYNLALGLTFSEEDKNAKLKLQVRGYLSQEPTQRSVGGSGDLSYGLTGGGGGQPGINLKFGVKGGYTTTFQPTGPDIHKPAFETKVGVEFTF